MSRLILKATSGIRTPTTLQLGESCTTVVWLPVFFQFFWHSNCPLRTLAKFFVLHELQHLHKEDWIPNFTIDDVRYLISDLNAFSSSDIFNGTNGQTSVAPYTRVFAFSLVISMFSGAYFTNWKATSWMLSSPTSVKTLRLWLASTSSLAKWHLEYFFCCSC